MVSQRTRRRRKSVWLVAGIVTVAAAGALALAWPTLVRCRVLARLDDPDPSVRKRALWDVAARRDVGATEALIDVLGTDRNHEVREAAGYCLYKLGDPRGIEPLRQAVEGVPDGVIRAKMIGYLANLEGLAAAERLWKWSESKEPWRAIGAAAGLLEIGDPRGGELLLRFAAEGRSDRRQFVAERLRRLAGPMMEMIGEHADLSTKDRNGFSAQQLKDLQTWWHKRATKKLLNDYLAWRRNRGGKWRQIGRLLHARDEASELLNVD